MLFSEMIMFPVIVPLYLLAFCRVVVGLAFALSGISKALNLAQFRQAIRNFNLLPSWLSGIAAVLFLCSEFAVVILVILGGPLLAIGFSLAIFLLLLFCIALVSVLIRRIRTSCNCFGPGAKLVSRSDVWRNIGFMLCALGGWAGLGWTRNTQGNLGLLAWVLTGLGAGAFVVIWIQLGEIVQFFHQD